jgi:F-type H+-transporting ATPase subunit alpha
VVAIYAGTNGYLDKIATRDVGRFEKSMLGAMRERAGDILADIRKEKQLSDGIKAKLKSFLDGFAASFA